MSLPKAQQYVIDKMKLGWTLYEIGDCGTEAYIKESNDNVFNFTGVRVTTGTVGALSRKGLICIDPVGRNDHWVCVFKLTGS